MLGLWNMVCVLLCFTDIRVYSQGYRNPLFLMEEETVKKHHEDICAPGSTNFSNVPNGINISNI